MALLEYKCPNCTGAINFDPGTQEMVCPYCEGSFYVSYSDDRFLDTKVVKTRIPAQTSSSGGGSSGGSSTHTSSSGRSHGGGGRKF